MYLYQTQKNTTNSIHLLPSLLFNYFVANLRHYITASKCISVYLSKRQKLLKNITTVTLLYLNRIYILNITRFIVFSFPYCLINFIILFSSQVFIKGHTLLLVNVSYLFYYVDFLQILCCFCLKKLTRLSYRTSVSLELAKSIQLLF